MKSGQILILVLLIVVVSLAVGLSVASRNLTNLRISTQTQESQRAFSAAEGGVEDVLSRLETLATPGSQSQADLISVGGYNDTFDVGDTPTTVKVFGRNVYKATVENGQVAQVNLVKSDGSKYSGNISIEWLTNIPNNPFSSIELTFICEGSGSYTCVGAPVSGTYSQNRFAFSDSTPPAEQQGFTICPASPCSSAGTEYKWRVSFDTGGNVRLMRIKSFYNSVDVRVSASSGSPDLPTQIYEINSVAKTDLGITRRVQVTRTSLPALPAVFDYVLYSEGDIVK